MKKLIFAASLLTLTACSTPDYSQQDTNNNSTLPVIEEVSTDVIAFNGIVLGITEDNQLKVQVPKRDEAIQQGLVVNEEGIVKVALAAIEMPQEQSDMLQLNKYMTDALVGENVNLEIAPSIDAGELQAYVDILSEDGGQELLQKQLIDSGLVILKTNLENIDYEKYRELFNTLTQDEIKNALEMFSTELKETQK